MWKDIPGYEGVYQVTESGEVRSLDRVVKNWPSGTRKIKGRKLKPGLNGSGYLRFSARAGHLFVHRCVAMAFIENPLGLNTVNHKDGNKTNNNKNNLEWCTKEYNHKHAWESGLCDSMKKPVLCIDQSGFGFWLPSMHAASWASPSLIHAAINGRQKTHRGMEWHYCPIPEDSEYAQLMKKQES